MGVSFGVVSLVCFFLLCWMCVMFLLLMSVVWCMCLIVLMDSWCGSRISLFIVSFWFCCLWVMLLWWVILRVRCIFFCVRLEILLCVVVLVVVWCVLCCCVLVMVF